MATPVDRSGMDRRSLLGVLLGVAAGSVVMAAAPAAAAVAVAPIRRRPLASKESREILYARDWNAMVDRVNELSAAVGASGG